MSLVTEESLLQQGGGSTVWHPRVTQTSCGLATTPDDDMCTSDMRSLISFVSNEAFVCDKDCCQGLEMITARVSLDEDDDEVDGYVVRGAGTGGMSRVLFADGIMGERCLAGPRTKSDESDTRAKQG